MIVSDDGRRFALDKHELTALADVMGDPEERVNLAGLMLDPARGQAWASNGHVAMVVDPVAKPHGRVPRAGVHLPHAVVTSLAKTTKARDLVVLTLDPPQVEIEIRAVPRGVEPNTWRGVDSATVRQTMTIKAKPPAMATIEHLFPTTAREPAPGIALDPRYLKSAVALSRVALLEHEILIHVGPMLDPVLFVANGRAGCRWRPIIMPRRSTALDTAAATTGTKKKRAIRSRGGKLRAAS